MVKQYSTSHLNYSMAKGQNLQLMVRKKIHSWKKKTDRGEGHEDQLN